LASRCTHIIPMGLLWCIFFLLVWITSFRNIPCSGLHRWHIWNVLYVVLCTGCGGGNGKGLRLIYVFNFWKSSRTRTCLLFLGVMKVGAAHSEATSSWRTTSLMSRLTYLLMWLCSCLLFLYDGLWEDLWCVSLSPFLLLAWDYTWSKVLTHIAPPLRPQFSQRLFSVICMLMISRNMWKL